MSEMIERVAAFLKERDEALGTQEADDAERTESARLIIAEMRDPTEEMLAAGDTGFQWANADRATSEDIEEIWEYMIDAALNK